MNVTVRLTEASVSCNFLGQPFVEEEVNKMDIKMTLYSDTDS